MHDNGVCALWLRGALLCDGDLLCLRLLLWNSGQLSRVFLVRAIDHVQPSKGDKEHADHKKDGSQDLLGDVESVDEFDHDVMCVPFNITIP